MLKFLNNAKNKRIFIITLIFTIGVAKLWAYPSLLFTKEENQLIYEHIHRKNIFKNTIVSSEIFYLSAILYIDPKNWTVWINNQIINAAHPHVIKGLAIKRVTAFNVDFSWTSPHSPLPVLFTLRPHQIFIRKGNRLAAKREKSSSE